MSSLLQRLSQSWAVRLAITVALLAVVAAQVDWATAFERTREGSWGWFVGALAAALASFVIAAERWRIFLRASALATPASEARRAYFIGVFSNTFLPTGFGGDAARTWIVGRPRNAVARTAATVLADRATSLACGFLLTWLALFAAPHDIPGSIVKMLALATIGGGMTACVVLVMLRSRSPAVARRIPRRLRRWSADGREVLIACFARRRVVVETIALGLLFQLAGVGTYWLLAKVIGVAVTFPMMAATVSLVLVATVVPVSVAGFGVREGGFVLLLGRAGVDATDATIIALLSVVTFALASTPGAIALLRPGHRRAMRPAELTAAQDE